MSEQKLKNIYLKLSAVCVFKNVLEKPLFKAFFNYIEKQESNAVKLRNYAGFVSEIYKNGASLPALVSKYVFEDENIYIKSVASKTAINKNIHNSVLCELKAFSEFAALSSGDFGADMGLESEIPCFDDGSVDISEEYKIRLKNIDMYGYGIFSSYCMFRISDSKEIEPIVWADKITLDSFIGYSEERQKIIDNTEAFTEGRPAANVLLYGDAGTGKSSTVKAIANEYYKRGVRLIEIRKDQLFLLPYVMDKIGSNPLKFIIFTDDLSFSQNDDNFSMLKATLEGSASCKTKNSVIYATSNRRHIVKENFSERNGDDIHRNDTVQETLSLSERFGLTVPFYKPDKKLYLEIVHALAERNGIVRNTEQLDASAEAFALKRGCRSARCAEQFVESLM